MQGDALVGVALGEDGKEGGGKVVGLGEEDVVFGEDVGPGGHGCQSGVVDGALEGNDGFDDLVAFEAQRLELGGRELGGGHWIERCGGQRSRDSSYVQI